MKKKVAFVCVGNSCRSQMAEGFGRQLGGDLIEVYSAGTDPALEINPTAILVMKEVGIDITEQHPKLLAELPEKVDLLITMGCNVQCPSLACEHREDWGLADPVGQPLEEFRKTRDLIREKIKALVAALKRQARSEI